LAGIDMYFNLFSDRYDFEKDKVNYDVFFLDPKNVILTGQGDINKHSMFVVNESCQDKQAAVRYIDWLFSNPEANKLIKYGIENKHYKIDPTGMLYFDETVKQIPWYVSLFTGYTVDTGILAPESIYITEGEDTITRRILKNYRIDAFTKVVLDSFSLDDAGNFETIADKYQKLLDKEGFVFSRSSEYDWRIVFLDLLDYHTEVEEYIELYARLQRSYKKEYMNELQSLLTGGQ
jgi:hypothetical protein